MKQSIVICFLLSATAVFAQKDETMFSDIDRIGGWGAPLFEYTNLNKDVEVVSGGGGALVLNDFYLGGYGMGTSSLFLNGEGQTDQSLKFKHGGFWLGYTPIQHRVVHPYLSVRLGWGKANYEEKDSSGQTLSKDRSSIFVTTPEAGLEVNVFSFFRIAATASYRWANGFDPAGGFGEDDLSGFGATLTLRFGGFGDDDWDNN
jgi:hypothetical protein